MTKDKLALGAGDNFHGSDTVHVDKCDLPLTDVVIDLEEGSLPFEDDSFSEVYAVHVLEHLSKSARLSIIKEMARVAKPGGLCIIVLPHHLTDNAVDFDHSMPGGSGKTFVQFIEGYSMNSPYPDLFEWQKLDYVFRERPAVNIKRKVFSDRYVAKNVPNSVEEIRYELKVK